LNAEHQYRIADTCATSATEDGQQQDRLKVAMVLTRATSGDSEFGRVKTLREILRALGKGFEVTELRVHSLPETRRIRDLMTAGARWILGLLVARPVPLQTVLYSGGSEIERLTNSIVAGNFDALYLDSIRCQILMRKIRNRLPDLHLVVDLDDLMSRRMEQVALKHVSLSLGFLRELFPKPLQWLIQGPLSGLIARYEGAALKAAELEMVRSAQAVVLVSSTERDILRLRLTPEARKVVHSLPPPPLTYRDAPAAAAPFRFVFIGSDCLSQNRLSIDFLIELWRRLRPSACLHIYGRQKRSSEQTDNVIWHGFIDDVSAAYAIGSILLVPCMLDGGIKTKIIESWSFGCPVLGNPSAFEGIELPSYPLMQPESQWADYVLQPEAHLNTWTSAAKMGNLFVRTILSSEKYGEHWRRLITPHAGEMEIGEIPPRTARAPISQAIEGRTHAPPSMG